MNFKTFSRGLTWVGVGVALLVVGLAIGRPFVVRGTNIPFGLVVVGLGLIVMAYDGWKASRRKDDGSPRDR